MKSTTPKMPEARPSFTIELCDRASEIEYHASDLLCVVEIVMQHVSEILENAGSKLSAQSDHYYITPEARRRISFLTMEAETRARDLSDATQAHAEMLIANRAAEQRRAGGII